MSKSKPVDTRNHALNGAATQLRKAARMLDTIAEEIKQERVAYPAICVQIKAAEERIGGVLRTTGMFHN